MILGYFLYDQSWNCGTHSFVSRCWAHVCFPNINLDMSNDAKADRQILSWSKREKSSPFSTIWHYLWGVFITTCNMYNLILFFHSSATLLLFSGTLLHSLLNLWRHQHSSVFQNTLSNCPFPVFKTEYSMNNFMKNSYSYRKSEILWKTAAIFFHDFLKKKKTCSNTHICHFTMPKYASALIKYNLIVIFISQFLFSESIFITLILTSFEQYCHI